MTTRRLTVVLLACWAVGCARPGRGTEHTIPTEEGGARASYDEALATLRDGRLNDGLAQLEASRYDVHARMLLAVMLNRPQDALNESLDPVNPVLLYLRALAALRDGRYAMLAPTVELLSADSTRSFDVSDLEAIAAMLRATEVDQMRARIRDNPQAATFDPSIGVPIIEVATNGGPARFVFDTGAEMSVVDLEAAARLDVTRPGAPRVTLQANTGEMAAEIGLLRHLTVLGREMGFVPVVLADLALPEELDVSGVIGAQDLFGDSVVRIDYQQGSVSYGGQTQDTGTRIAFMDGRALVGVEGRIDGGVPGIFEIDTGGRRSTLTDSYVDRSQRGGAAWNVSGPVTVDIRAVGVVRATRTFLASGRFCFTGQQDCIPLEDVPIDTTAADAGTGQAGKLGADAFAGRVLELDYPACRMRLTQ